MNVPCEQCAWNPTLTVTAEWKLWINVPAYSLNTIKGNWHRYNRTKQSYLAALEKQATDIPVAKHKRRVLFYRMFAGRSRIFDRDNLIGGFKPVRDCLTNLGIIKDDTDRWLEAHYNQFKGPKAAIFIKVQDILWTQ